MQIGVLGFSRFFTFRFFIIFKAILDLFPVFLEFSSFLSVFLDPLAFRRFADADFLHFILTVFLVFWYLFLSIFFKTSFCRFFANFGCLWTPNFFFFLQIFHQFFGSFSRFSDFFFFFIISRHFFLTCWLLLQISRLFLLSEFFLPISWNFEFISVVFSI